MARFGNASVDDINDLNDEKDSINTKRAIKQGVRIMKEYLVAKNLETDFENLPPVELDILLEHFYIDVRTKKGLLYKASAFTLIKFALNKHLMKEKNLDLQNDSTFAKSNRIYLSVCTKLKKEGLAMKVHKEPINDGDMRRLYTCGVFDPSTPTGLLQKVWFEVMFYLCRRGRQNLREMNFESLKVVVDDDGFEYITMAKDELTKNHRKADDPASTARMYALIGKFSTIFFKLKYYTLILTLTCTLRPL